MPSPHIEAAAASTRTPADVLRARQANRLFRAIVQAPAEPQPVASHGYLNSGESFTHICAKCFAESSVCVEIGPDVYCDTCARAILLDRESDCEEAEVIDLGDAALGQAGAPL